MSSGHVRSAHSSVRQRNEHGGGVIYYHAWPAWPKRLYRDRLYFRRTALAMLRVLSRGDADMIVAVAQRRPPLGVGGLARRTLTRNDNLQSGDARDKERDGSVLGDGAGMPWPRVRTREKTRCENLR